jgi:hypothetical protein
MPKVELVVLVAPNVFGLAAIDIIGPVHSPTASRVTRAMIENGIVALCPEGKEVPT